ncbi:Spermatid maturation protein 1 [Camelus dromedarius]|uniref:Spermatid maturation protein 1 n=1 Tax=Camelus dromedarius TaxID=9838 RepID=A0A5N4D6B1_CAMDR|nr:Spermatid maturation protein 1 [Camelus dromedarius]
MAMAERPRPRWASYHSPNTNNCQDLGNSILLLLGLIVCINIGINMVTLVRVGPGGRVLAAWLGGGPGGQGRPRVTVSSPTQLWRRLRGFLHQVFHVICEKEASKSRSPGKQTQPPKQCSQAVHLRCTVDPVKMTVTPPPTRRHRHRGSAARRARRLVDWVPDTDEDNEEERPPHQRTVTSHNWDCPEDWDGFQSTQRFWTPWAQDAVETPTQTIRFQQTIEERPLKREMQSELGLQAYVYPVNPPPPSPQALSHRNIGGGTGAGAQAEQEQCLPAQPPILGPANVPDIPRRRSSGRIAYDARDVRRRLRELSREVEALSHCYPLGSGSSAAEGTDKDWVYRSMKER